MSTTLEICACDYDSAVAAWQGGAMRIELCSGLAEGGLTPSAALIKMAAQLPIKVNVLIRPRSGDFLYTPAEVEIMKSDIEMARDMGANGVVIGALNADGTVDVDTCRTMLEAARGLDTTFHRAFDMTADPSAALEQVISLGAKRILTSGCAESALAGAQLLAALVKQADGRISIMAGGGVSPDNAAKIVALTGVHELHASAKALVQSKMAFRRGDVSMGQKGADEYSRHVTSAAIVKDIISRI